MRQPSSPAVLALALLFLADPRTAGAVLLDPTRPLAGGGREEAALPKPAEALAAAAAPLDTASAPAAPPALQSLQVPRQGEATAIVDGQLLKVGAKLGSYEVTHIDVHGLMVRGPGGRERWTLAGVEVLDSRQSAASLKMGPLGDVRKPAARRPAADPAVMPPEGLPRAQGAGAPSPLIFPLPAPQSQPVPLPRPAPSLEQAPPAAPLPTAPTRPAVKQAMADATSWAPVAAPMTVAYQPMVPAPAPVRAAPVPKRGAKAHQTWTAAAPRQALRMDLDDMRRIIQMSVQPSAVAAASPSAARWQRPVGPHTYGAWAAVWGAMPASSQRQALSLPSSGLVLARWQAPKPLLAKASAVRYSAVSGPRPMPASVVWRQATAPKAWQPQGVTELPGTHTSQWASAPAAPLRIAALEAKPSTPRSFAPAYAKPLPRTWAGTRWAQVRSAPTTVAAAPVTHAYPMAMPNWRNAPPAPADTPSLTQVAYALETP